MTFGHPRHSTACRLPLSRLLCLSRDEEGFGRACNGLINTPARISEDRLARAVFLLRERRACLTVIECQRRRSHLPGHTLIAGFADRGFFACRRATRTKYRRLRGAIAETLAEGLSRMNPSGYVEPQDAFAQRLASEMKERAAEVIFS